VTAWEVKLWCSLRPIPEFENYYVSFTGAVWSYFPHRSFGRRKGWRRIKPFLRDRYLGVWLFRGSERHRAYVHQLVLAAYVGPCPPGKLCRHKDGNRFNNAARNLAYSTHAENMADRQLHGRTARGERVGTAKLKDRDVITIRREVYVTASPKELAARFRVRPETILDAARGRTFRHLAA
jgi:hypothetical protein